MPQPLGPKLGLKAIASLAGWLEYKTYLKLIPSSIAHLPCSLLHKPAPQHEQPQGTDCGMLRSRRLDASAGCITHGLRLSWVRFDVDFITQTNNVFIPNRGTSWWGPNPHVENGHVSTPTGVAVPMSQSP